MIDPAFIGTAQPERAVEVERGRLRAFAHAIGEIDPVYTELDAARAAGHPDLPVPPTFLFGLGLGGGQDNYAWLADLGVDLLTVLHGEQQFTYHGIAYAGDILRFTPRITDIFSKKKGALQFMVRDISVQRDDGSPVAELRETLIVRESRA